MLGYIVEVLQIQEELVRAKKLIPDTEAGQHLQYSLNQLLKTLDNKKRTTTSLDPAQIASIADSTFSTRFFDVGGPHRSPCYCEAPDVTICIRSSPFDVFSRCEDPTFVSGFGSTTLSNRTFNPQKTERRRGEEDFVEIVHDELALDRKRDFLGFVERERAGAKE